MREEEISEDEILQAARRLRAAMNEVVVLWHNNLRFASEERLRGFLHQAGRLQGVKGNPLKKNALDLLNAAQVLVNQGQTLWTFGKK
jgi:hypothetical protein